VSESQDEYTMVRSTEDRLTEKDVAAMARIVNAIYLGNAVGFLMRWFKGDQLALAEGSARLRQCLRVVVEQLSGESETEPINEQLQIFFEESVKAEPDVARLGSAWNQWLAFMRAVE